VFKVGEFYPIPFNKERTMSERRWWQKISKRQVTIGLFFVIALTLFLHVREKEIEGLGLGSISDRYIVAQVDFKFADEEATERVRQESARDVGFIFKIDPKQLHELSQAFERELMENQLWRDQLLATTFKEMHKGAKAVEKAFLRLRFTDERTLKIAGDLRHGFDFLTMPEDLDEKPGVKVVEETLLTAGKEYQEAVRSVLAFFKEQRWGLIEDQYRERWIKEHLLSAIPLIHTQIDAGSYLIESGEKVTKRHIAMLRGMERALGKERDLISPLTLISSALLSLLFTALAVIYFRFKHPAILASTSKLSLLVTIVVATLVLSKGAEALLIDRTNSFIDVVHTPLFIPLASLLTCLLVGSEVALFISGFLAVTLSVSLAVDTDRFLVVNLMSAFVIILSAKSIHKRKEIFAICGKAWLACLPVILAFNFWENVLWTRGLMTDAISTFLFMAATALLVVGMLPLLESLFKVMTDMTLMEYMDPNNDLLRRLSLEAPGTYQHCLVVGNLAETAANAIRANGLFCRVSTLYHDVGKLSNPHHFAENQLGGFNIHPLITPRESASLIINHVPDGVTLARKHHIPESFIDIIREHHGTTLVYFFFHKEVELMGGDFAAVDQKLFRYAGPKPHTKESAIIMIADCVEAASRCCEETSEEGILKFIGKIIHEKAEEGQFDECPLSFEELATIKRAMAKTLLAACHGRVKYPLFYGAVLKETAAVETGSPKS
jgi:putative nucleotidyltransferase with HDIG domain